MNTGKKLVSKLKELGLLEEVSKEVARVWKNEGYSTLEELVEAHGDAVQLGNAFNFSESERGTEFWGDLAFKDGIQYDYDRSLQLYKEQKDN